MSTCFPKTDLAALVALPESLRVIALPAALRFVSVPDLRGAGVPDEAIRTAVRRGYLFRFTLQRRLTDAEATDVLAAGRKGAVELARAVGADAATVPSSNRKGCTRSAMFLDHSIAISAFALALARDMAGAPMASLLSWETDPDRLADSVHLMDGAGYLDRQPLVADGLAVVRGPRGPEGLLIEIDRGTERPSYLGRKYRGYLAWWKSGAPERRFNLKAIRILTVAADAKRSERLREACRETTDAAGAGLFWFASEDAVLKDGPLAPIWSTLRAEQIPLWS
jgi:hypothetical protein